MRFFRAFAISFSVVIVAGIIFLGGYVLGDQRGQHVSAASSAPGFDVLWQVRDLLNKEFLGDIPTTQAQAYGAAHGLAESFKDPYTMFVEPAPRTLERDDLNGQFGGIGAGVGRNQAGQFLLSPQANGPAARAGVQDGDELMAVDSKVISSTMTVDQVVVLVRGQIGTNVTLTLRRQGREGTFDVRITRARIETASVDWRMLDDAQHVGYIHISIFGARTGQELQNAIADLNSKGATRVVLDLRGNGGGLLDAAIDVASQFIHDGVILREQRRGGDEITYQARGVTSPAQDWPVALLVDGGTASASEIVAGALRDHGRATLIGAKTYGKGVVQQVHELPDGSSLHVTTARWLTPNRHQIDKTGLEPDLPVTLTADDHNAGRDPQLDAARSWIENPQPVVAPAAATPAAATPAATALP